MRRVLPWCLCFCVAHAGTTAAQQGEDAPPQESPTIADPRAADPAAAPHEPATTNDEHARSDESPQPEGPTTASALDTAAPDRASPERAYLDEYDDDEDYDEDYDEPGRNVGNVRVRYFLERIEVRGSHRTSDEVIRSYVPVEVGQILDPESEDVETIQWRLRATGWFSRVDLSIERGTRHGWVVLVIIVRERNTITVSGLTLGVSEGLNRTLDDDTDYVPYLGATLSETNLLGTGAQLSLAFLASSRAYGFRLNYSSDRLLPRGWGARVAPFFYKARQYYGHEPLVTFACPDDIIGCEEEATARNAVVFYRRGGVSLGTGHDLSGTTRLHFDYTLDVLERRAGPEAASERRGGPTAPPTPIDFAIHRGVSYVSRFSVGVSYDRRDDPSMTSRGVLVRFDADLGHPVIGSDYDFLRARLLVRGWLPLRHGRSLRLGVFAGAIFGNAPFFLKFQVSDMTDLVPSRILEMQIDRRGGHVLDTSIGVMQAEDLAARVDLQYELPLFRGERRLRGINAYFNLGAYTLLSSRDLTLGVAGYDGAARLPIDLTFDLGLRFDTDFGVFRVGFSTLLGLVDVEGLFD